MIRYVMVSSEIRRDLEQPLQLFRKLEVYHLYNRAGWNDMDSRDFGSRTQRFRYPFDLYRHLEAIQPEIIQGPEPLSLLMFPYLLAVFWYLIRHPSTELVCMSQETIPLERKYGRVVAGLMKPVLGAWFRRAMLLLWLDHSSRRNMISLGAPEEKLHYLLYGCWGVDLDAFKPDEGPFPCRDPLVILCVARLVPEKGVQHLIEAFRQIRETGLLCSLVVVGDGAYRKTLEHLAQETGYGDDVAFVGSKRHAELPGYFRGASLLVLPALRGRLWTQHISTSTWHAMACGLPVIASDIGEMRLYTPDDVGVLVPERDPRALAEAVTALLLDADRHRKMGAAARDYASRTFDIKKNVLQAESLIISTMVGRSGLSKENGTTRALGV